MKTYETTFIINPQTDDATLEKHVSDIADIITASKGNILHRDNMGTRRLAYEINGLTQGYYANFLYEAPAEVLPRLDKHFKTNEMYLRNLTVKFEGDLERHLKSLQNPFAEARPDDKRMNDHAKAEPATEKTPTETPAESKPAEETAPVETPEPASEEKPAEEEL